VCVCVFVCGRLGGMRGMEGLSVPFIVCDGRRCGPLGVYCLGLNATRHCMRRISFIFERVCPSRNVSPLQKEFLRMVILKKIC
jgi:hypothetical protein